MSFFFSIQRESYKSLIDDASLNIIDQNEPCIHTIVVEGRKKLVMTYSINAYTFSLFVLPSKLYRKQFQKIITRYRISIHKCFYSIIYKGQKNIIFLSIRYFPFRSIRTHQ